MSFEIKQDEGWAWCVCLGSFLINFVTSIYMNCGGVVLSALVDNYNVARSEAGKIRNIFRPFYEASLAGIIGIMVWQIQHCNKNNNMFICLQYIIAAFSNDRGVEWSPQNIAVSQNFGQISRVSKSRFFAKSRLSLDLFKQRKSVKKRLGLAKICLVSESRKVSP